jgi:predicted mannosyl-3-phosphoglycerate phosphatase (HAD superfamily)
MQALELQLGKQAQQIARKDSDLRQGKAALKRLHQALDNSDNDARQLITGLQRQCQCLQARNVYMWIVLLRKQCRLCRHTTADVALGNEDTISKPTRRYASGRIGN